MEWIRESIVLTALILNTILDMRKRRVSVAVILLMTACALVWRLVCHQMEWSDILLGLIPGLIAWLIAVATDESIGYGDVWMILGMGIAVGGTALYDICMTALFLAGMTALILVCLFRKERRYEIPFVPFLLAGYLFCCIGG